ncbi:MAG: hypothetical protein OXE76_03335 [Alphaproteobacteria bacterium]|nr:hypothetical protein [Alphaproteobacteria bacterium]
MKATEFRNRPPKLPCLVSRIVTLQIKVPANKSTLMGGEADRLQHLVCASTILAKGFTAIGIVGIDVNSGLNQNDECFTALEKKAM